MPVPTPRSLLRVHPHRLLVAPRVDVRPSGEVRVTGMACAVCAARTRAALASVPGVEAVAVDLDAERATVRMAPGARADVRTMQAAVDRVVVGMGMRRWIERVMRRARQREA